MRSSKWIPLRFAHHPGSSNPTFPNVYLTTDPSSPDSLIVTPDFEFPIPFVQTTTNDHELSYFSQSDLGDHSQATPPLTVNELADSFNPMFTSNPFYAGGSLRRPNKLRKPPPSKGTYTALQQNVPLQVLSSTSYGDGEANLPRVHSGDDVMNDRVDSIPVSPTPSALTTVSVGSQVPLLQSGLLRQMSTPARKLTKKKPANEPNYVRISTDLSNITNGSFGHQAASPDTDSSQSTSQNNIHVHHQPHTRSPESHSTSPTEPVTSGAFSSGLSLDKLIGRGRKINMDPASHKPHRSLSEGRYQNTEAELLPPLRATSPFQVNMVSIFTLSATLSNLPSNSHSITNGMNDAPIFTLVHRHRRSRAIPNHWLLLHGLDWPPVPLPRMSPSPVETRARGGRHGVFLTRAIPRRLDPPGLDPLPAATSPMHLNRHLSR